MRLKPYLTVIILLTSLSSCMSNDEGIKPDSATPATIFSLDQVGPFKIGSRYTDVATAHKLTLRFSSETVGDPVSKPTGEGCEKFGPGPGWDGVSLMFEDGILTRIDLYDPDGPGPRMPMAAITDKGAKLGMTIDRIKALYSPRVKQTPHPYGEDSDWYLRWQPGDDSKYGMVFETTGTTVESFRVGMANSVQYIEGCA